MKNKQKECMFKQKEVKNKRIKCALFKDIVITKADCEICDERRRP